MRISDWSSDVCSSDLHGVHAVERRLPVGCAVEGADHDLVSTRGHHRFRAPHGAAYRPAAFHQVAADRRAGKAVGAGDRSEEHTSELQSLMRISYAVFCLKKKNISTQHEMNREKGV